MKRLLYRLYKLLDEHSSACEFFDEFGLVIQSILGLICLTSLIFKRYTEKPQRPWIIWFFDTFKQVVGQLSQHFSNLYIAHQIGHTTGLKCEWYLNVLITDSTIGVYLCFLYLTLLLWFVKNSRFDFKTGDYGQTETEPNKWQINCVMCQILWWILIVIVAKFTSLGLLLMFYQIFEKIGIFILAPIKNNPKLKLIFVMIIFPTFFTILQFWLTDNIIKKDDEIIKEKIEKENNQNKEPVLIVNLDEAKVVESTKINGKESSYKALPQNDV